MTNVCDGVDKCVK
jgi:hypothetical protein